MVKFNPIYVSGLVVCATMLFSGASQAQQYEGRGNQRLYRQVESLEREVDDLKRQVNIMQGHIDRLTARLAQLPGPGPYTRPVTCTLRSFGSVYSATASTRGQALALVLDKCARGSHALACSPRNAICDD